MVALPFLVYQAQAQTKPHPSPHRTRANKASVKTASSSAAKAIRLNNLGTAYMNQQAFEKALNFFSQAFASDPKLEMAQVNKGIALLSLQRYAEARQVLSQATAHNSQSARAWYNLGLTYKALGQSQLALPAFQKAAQLEPSDTDAFYLVGSMQSQLGNEREAIAAFQKSLQLAPENASAEFGLARSLQRVKDTEAARAHLARFDHITKNKQGKLMSPAYGEQGVLSVAVPVRGEQHPVPAIPVKFSDVTAQVGLSRALPPRDTMDSSPEAPVACFLDYDNDGRPDLLASFPDRASSSLALYHNLGDRFADVAAATMPHLSGTMSACAAGDFDNDGFTDLVLGISGGLVLLRNDKGHFVDVTASSGLSTGSARPSSLTFLDYDHDGDLDLLVATDKPGNPAASRLHLWRNNGNGSFTDVTDALGFNVLQDAGIAMVSDYNNDRASDVVLSGPGTILVNPREGPWKKLPIGADVPSGRGMAILDFNKDGWMDIALATPNGLVLYRNVSGQRFERVNVPGADQGPLFGVAALDYDNDGWIDLAVAGSDNKGHSFVNLFRNEGPSGFVNVTTKTGLNAISVSLPRGLLTADYDRDGDVDLLITQADGKLVLVRNEGGNQNNFLRLSLKGLADNKSAIGTKVEVFAGAVWQKWEVSPAAYNGQNSPEIIAGLGSENSVDVVRLLWPTGVVQDEAQIPANTAKAIGEIDRRGSSCPLLFVWDGKQYQFVADMIGAGVVGHWISPTEKNTPDPTEYIKIEGVSPARKHGRLSFRFMEPMEEVVYLDQVRLLAVDHPGNVEVYPNEYFASNPPFPAFKLITSRNASPPAAAWDDTGRDVRSQLVARDHEYVTGFTTMKWMGFTQPHSLTLELPQPYDGGPLHLLMNGYIEYFMANSMYAAYQAGVEPFAPYLDAQTTDGHWTRVVDDIGFPAGLRRTMTVDLTGKLPRGTRQIRLTTNLQIYWDQILFDTSEPDTTHTKLTEVPLASAQLAWRGYPRMFEARTPGDLTFDYQQTSRAGPYVRQAGSYTRYGDVIDLVSGVDDRFVVFGSGDEVQIDFDPANLPALPAGWKRDYIFFADGFEKDMDFYAAEGTTVAPLPFHSMRSYPYRGAEHFPDDPGHLQYRLEYNDRHESGSWPRSFQFEYTGTDNRQ